MSRIKWTGMTTDMRTKWEVEADTMNELYDKLTDMGVISVCDYFPDYKFIVERGGYNYYEFESEVYDVAEKEGLGFIEVFEDYCKKKGISVDVTEDDYKEIILRENGNAYYQEFEIIDKVTELKKAIKCVMEKHDVDFLYAEEMSYLVEDMMEVYLNHLREYEPYAFSTIRDYEKAKQMVGSLSNDLYFAMDCDNEL